MIVPMKRLMLLCVADDAGRTLDRLRDLGVVHLELSPRTGSEGTVAKGELEDAERAVRIVMKAVKECHPQNGAVCDAPGSVDEILSLNGQREAAKGMVESLRAEIRRYEPFGDFDVGLARRLESSGIRLQLWDDGTFDFIYGEDQPAGRAGVRPVPLPSERLAVLRGRLADAEAEEARLAARIASADADGIVRMFPQLRDAVAFAVAKDEMAANRFSDDSVADAPQISLVRGWVPVDGVEALRSAAKECGWGIALRDPDADENPPTLIRPPKLFRSVTAMFDGLGIAPGYTETDVSVPFMCYFSLFFAMLVGDGGYGAIILAAALYGWFKTRPKSGGSRPVAVSSWLTLLTVFASATIAWGFLSNTWFGEGLPFAQDWPTVKWLADPSYNNMMLLCFTIGVSHLMLARIWTGLCMLNDRTCLSQFGWAGVLLFMYLVTNSIVGIFDGIPVWGYWMFGVSLVCIFGFTLKGSELKTRGIELGMLPLNIMSALGDIISYVRLFAVGLASVKVAQNFNMMATGMDLPLWLKIVPMVLILLLGHGLNLAMAGLSILVHAVRLNTLEFSSHKGISWSGYAFAPFRRH